jgi:ABC-type sugar transport system substrate-binding protein
MAQELVEAWLAKYDQIDVIHTAGDPHALGAVAALKAVRPELVGEVLISGFNGDEPTTQAIIDGEVFVTAGLPVAWQGAMGLAIPLAAKNGEYVPSELPREQREFFFNSVIVTQENAQDWMDNNIKGLPEMDYTDLWGNVGAPMNP